MMSVHSCVRGRISVHLPVEWRFRCIHVWGVRFWCIWGMMISVHSCVREILLHLLEGWGLRCIHVWGVGYRYKMFVHLPEKWRLSLHLPEKWRFSVHSCVRGRISVHLLEKWTISVHSCVRGRLSLHLPEEWRFLCIHVWGVRFQCIYLRDDDFCAFMCQG